MAFTQHHASLGELKALFRTLPAPEPALRRGFFRATFIGPAFIRLTARPTLEITGLPGWQGKTFLDADNATNILLKDGVTVQHLAMQVTPVTSYVDGQPGLALTYGALSRRFAPPSPASGRGAGGEGVPAPLPWRFVRDEIRRFDENTILAFTFVDLPLLRHIGFPFLLVREG
jgi:hypothetical protein